MRERLSRWLSYIDFFVDGVIILNTVLILLSTEVWFSSRYQGEVDWVLHLSTWIFVGEIALRIVCNGYQFFCDRWSLFDFVVTLVSSLTLSPGLMSLRLLRVFRLVRLFRLFSINAPLRSLTQSLLVALPRVLWTGCFFVSLFCIYATIGIDAYGKSYPEFFGSVGDTFFTLFQVMTLESWATGVAREVMATEAYAWLYFVSFILLSTYILLNLLFGVITSATIETYERQRATDELRDSAGLRGELEALREQLARVQRLLQDEESKP